MSSIRVPGTTITKIYPYYIHFKGSEKESKRCLVQENTSSLVMNRLEHHRERERESTMAASLSFPGMFSLEGRTAVVTGQSTSHTRSMSMPPLYPLPTVSFLRSCKRGKADSIQGEQEASAPQWQLLSQKQVQTLYLSRYFTSQPSIIPMRDSVPSICHLSSILR